jgi:hypothetical protein
VHEGIRKERLYTKILICGHSESRTLAAPSYLG